ncbi:MAG: response regulator transcription factor [Proteobacteria bacterium]|nr:response regulator transcription factor [Pseudomonadota bacterium]
MRLLLVEDEPVLRDQLANRLRQDGYAVDTAIDGEEGLFYAAEYPIDLAIVDLGLPKISGIELIQQLRKQGKDVPVLILTARNKWQDKVEGLESGADDYLAKPFHYEELAARVKALIRRAAGQADPVISVGDVSLNSVTQDVLKNGEALELTAYEYRLLHYLMLNAGKVISKMELTDHLYEEDTDRDSNVIEVFIRRLRKKLDPDGSLEPIETLRGRGYRYVTD